MPPYASQNGSDDPLVITRRRSAASKRALQHSTGGMIDERQSRWAEKLPTARELAQLAKLSVLGAGRTAAATPFVVRSTHDRVQWVLDRDPTGSLRPAIRILGASAGVVATGLAIVVGLGSAYGVDGWAGSVPAIARAESAVVETVKDAIPDVLTPGSDDSTSVAVDIPRDYLVLYQEAAKTCDMDWAVLAGVGSVETNHGRSNAPGVHSGANFAGARGPMQFLDATWNAYGVDGNGDGKRNVFDPRDAVPGAANYLCANGAGEESRVDNALWHYNHDYSYVAKVKDVASDYRDRAYAVPLSGLDAAAMSKDHHDYPAVDVAVPTGTPVHAVHGGRVTLIDESRCGWGVSIKGNDGATYLYCHASARNVRNGQQVVAGEQIMQSGGMPGSRGAGSSTGPHLHLQIEANSRLVCPQGLIEAWARGEFETPEQAPTSGCSS